MKYSWEKTHIKTIEDGNVMVNTIKHSTFADTYLDTETTGLHIIKDKPFIVQWGFTDPSYGIGRAYAVDLERDNDIARKVIKYWEELSARPGRRLVMHNAKYDLHMLENIGLPYTTENVTDTMFYIRHAHDALSEDKGGPSLRLKQYATKYVDVTAKLHEHALAAERTAIASNLNRKLLKEFLKGRLMKDIKPFLDDKITDPSDMSPEDYAAYQQWLEWLPDWIHNRFDILIDANDVPYNVLNRENVIKYALNDIVFTAEILAITEPIVQVRGTQNAIDFENKLIFPLYDMERTGFAANKEYLQESKKRLKQYILSKRTHLALLAGAPLKVGQHKVILQLLNNRFSIPCAATGNEELSRIASTLKHTGERPDALAFIETIQELRTLEKWYSTYLLRFERTLLRSDRLYTQINQVGTVSGRVTSDFQQFPKEGILATTGEELFHPRKLVQVSGGEYNALVYLDYSQIELRFQALYTILVAGGDKNLCRAYMPYGCVDSHGSPFCYDKIEDIQRWKDPWFLEEDPTKHWKPVDVHGATAIIAFDTHPEDKDYKHYRSLAKRINFAKNYGAQLNRIREMFPEFDDAQLRKINDSYYKAFPGVRKYHQYCNTLAMATPYAENLFGIRYYNVPGHNLINMLIQGSSAYFLKMKIRELWEYAKAHNIKSRMQMTIHDENSWEKFNGEEDIFFIYKQIMEDWPDTLVPIVAEMEVSFTTWADKVSANTAEELKGEEHG